MVVHVMECSCLCPLSASVLIEPSLKPSSQYCRTAARHGFCVAIAHRTVRIELSSILVVNARHDTTAVRLLWDQNSVILMHYISYIDVLQQPHIVNKALHQLDFLLEIFLEMYNILYCFH